MSKASKKSLSDYFDTDLESLDEKNLIKVVQKEITKSGSKGLTNILAELILKDHSQNLRIKSLEQQISLMASPVLEGLKVAKNLKSSILLTADSSLSDEHGFYDLERPESGRSFRWTGCNGGVFDVLIDLNRSEARQLKLTVLKNEYSNEIVGKNIFLTVDGEDVPPKVKESDGVHEYIFELEPDDKEISTHCVFRTKTWRPVDVIEGAGDERKLGVMFVKLEAS